MDELNQVPTETIETNDNAGLFDDYSAPETTETAEEAETLTSPTVESATEETPNPFELRVKYNGEEQTLTEDEARTYAQKGMNYDRIYEPIERLARMNGMSVGDYLNRLNDTQFQYEVSREIETLRENPKYEGVSDEVLEEIATNRVNESIGARDRNYEEQLKGQADAQQEQIKKEVDKFLEEYPEFKNKGPDTLDPQVYEYVKQGYTLLEAYNKWNRQVQLANKPQEDAKAKTSKLNEENKNRSLGNTTNAGSVEVDDFLSGFLNG